MRVVRPRLGLVCPYPPRRSGLAGYGGELARLLGTELDVVVCAVDRHPRNFPDEVVAVIGSDELADYRRAGRILAEHRVDAVLIQFDDALFGGPSGAHVLDLAHELRLRGIPYLVQLHALHRAGDAAFPRTLSALAQGATRVLVPTQDARRWLTARHLVDADKLRVVRAAPSAGPVPAATPDAPAPVRPALAAALAGPGRILSTIGSIRAGKGLETALAALPKILASCPDAVYLVAGTTTGDGYDDGLRELVVRRGLGDSVFVLDGSLSPAELAALLARTEVYLAPAIPAERTASGSLTAAVAAGCACVVGQHPYPAELLAGTPARPPAGLVVPEEDAEAMADAVLSLLGDRSRADEIRSSAAAVGRHLAGARVARRVGDLVREVVRPRSATSLTTRTSPDSAPPVRLDGIAGGWDLPGDAGLAVAARQAVVAAALLALPPEVLPTHGWTTAADWAQRAIRQLGAAPDDGTGWAAWGLGSVAGGSGVPEPLREEARSLCAARLDLVPTAPLPAAYAALGLARGAGRLRGIELGLSSSLGPDVAPIGGAQPLINGLSGTLAAAAGWIDAAWLRAGRGRSWPWYTERLDGAGVRLPHALIAAGRRLRDAAMVRRGLNSLDWYTHRVGLAGADGLLRLPPPSGEQARLEPAAELAVDAGALVEALVEAYRATGSSHYARLARRSFDWFHGANRHAEPIYVVERGWSHPGLRRDAPDRTRDGVPIGTAVPSVAATLAYLAALLGLAASDVLALPVQQRNLAPA